MWSPICSNKLRALAIGLLGLALFLAGPLPALADGVVRGFYFYSPDCAHCEVVAEEVLPLVQDRFGARLELRMFDIREPSNYSLLLALEERYSIDEVGLPEVFVGPDVLVGEEAVRTGLVALVEKHLAAGGVDFPTQDLPVPVSTPSATPQASGNPIIHLAYFYRVGCQECERVAYDLELMRSRFPGLRVTAFDINEEHELNEALAARVRLPEEQRLVAPAVFVGDEALVDGEITAARLETLLQRYAEAGAPPVWETVEKDDAVQSIVQRFLSFGALTVVGAGLVDGLNPCAFATIVFFISYLSFAGRSRREMLLTGAAFTVGVFLTYLLVGLGALRFLQGVSGLHLVGRAMYGLMGLACLVFAALSVHDAWQARRSRPEAMRLRLPRFLQRRVHAVIRESSSRPAFVGLAAVTGLVVSFLELACTGQVYLPTILFVLGRPELRLRAASYLVLYNLVFVAPLIVVFVIAALGVGSNRLAQFVQKHISLIKLLTAGVFVALGLWLLTVVL
ncbi:MAG: cytochrome c biogenesis protein CcdA [Anaerolineae bacterium]|nr:cytochrome c biogenesis protein CcdA [Anaerolineae bacterium]